MRILSVIVCYNLYFLVRNTLESLLEFFPFGDVLVIDNGSTNHKLVKYLYHRESSHPRLKIIFRMHNDDTRKTGSLYEANNLAITYAIERDYDLIYLAQDDVQYMWTDREILLKVAWIFDNEPNVSNISAIFQRKISDYRIGQILDIDYGGLSYLNRNYGVSDDGFFKVAWLADKNFRFMDSENAHSMYWLKQGYHTRHLRDPYIAFVPWPATRRAGKIIGREREPGQRYLLKPLEPEQIEALTQRPITEFPFSDDYCFPWGYSCLTPYWFTTPDFEYFDEIFVRRLRAKRLPLLPGFETRGMPLSARGKLWEQVTILFGNHEPNLFEMLRHAAKLRLRSFVYRVLVRLARVTCSTSTGVKRCY